MTTSLPSTPLPSTPPIKIHNYSSPPIDTNIIHRQTKLNLLKDKVASHNNANNYKYKKHRKIKTLKKIYHLGKKNGKVNVLIKNNVTRKKVRLAVKAIKKTPIIKIKKYLKKKHLVKTGSSAPEYILREMYTNALLTGDVHNTNNENLVHNYLDKEELN